jgi:hypothetical protein
VNVVPSEFVRDRKLQQYRVKTGARGLDEFVAQIFKSMKQKIETEIIDFF